MLASASLAVVDIRASDATPRIRQQLAIDGLVSLAGLNDRAAVLRTATALMRVRNHRDSDLDGVTTIERRIAYSATGSLAGFTDRELHPHTEGTAVATPPTLMLLACIRPADVGGRSILVDGAAVYAEIAATDEGMREALCAPRSAFFGGPAGHLGAIFAPQSGGQVIVRLRLDDLIRLAPAAALYRDKLRSIVRRHELNVDLVSGDGYVLRNDRWLHGRTRYSGPRQMLRLLGDPHPQHHLAGATARDPRSFSVAVDDEPVPIRRRDHALRPL